MILNFIFTLFIEIYFFYPGITLNLFYDAPEAPDGIFDSFLSVGHVSKDVSSRSFVDLIAATPSQLTSGMRYV